MNLGKTLFAQVMDFVPWTSFTRIRCLSTKLSAFLSGHRHFFWRSHMLPWRVQPHLLDVLPVARLP